MTNAKDSQRGRIAKWAFLLMLGGVLVPLVIGFVPLLLPGVNLSPATGRIVGRIALGLGFVTEVVALILGVAGNRHRLGKLAVAGASSALVVAAVQVASTKLSPNPTAEPPPATKDTVVLSTIKSSNESKSIRSTANPIFMVPVEQEGTTTTPKPIRWEELFPKIVQDSESQALARRLYWGIPVELTAVGKDDQVQAEQAESTSGPPFVRLQIQATASPSESSEKMLVGMWDYRRSSRRPLPETQTVTSPAQGTAAGGAVNFDDADDVEVLRLLCNDYLLRINAHWIVVGGYSLSNFRNPKLDTAQAKADLQKRIDGYLTKYVHPAKP